MRIKDGFFYLLVLSHSLAQAASPQTKTSKAGKGSASLAMGGQAVMEGVMIRNQGKLALAVRQPDGQIISQLLPWKKLFHGSWAKKKWVRGFPVLLEALTNGIKGLNASAAFAAQGHGESIKPWQMVLTVCSALALALGLFVLLPHLAAAGLNTLASTGAVEGFWFHFWDGLIKISILLLYITAISGLPEIRRVFAYHGAEHQVISAYEGGENPVTPAAAAAYSRLHPRCGTAFLLFVLCISILAHAFCVPALFFLWTPQDIFSKHAIALIFKLFLIIPISAIAYETIRFSAQEKSSALVSLLRWPGLFLQLLTTRRPDYQQLEVALVALQEALEPETHVSVSTTAFTRLGQDNVL